MQRLESSTRQSRHRLPDLLPPRNFQASLLIDPRPLPNLNKPLQLSY